jgi:hypothetical protein
MIIATSPSSPRTSSARARHVSRSPNSRFHCVNSGRFAALISLQDLQNII